MWWPSGFHKNGLRRPRSDVTVSGPRGRDGKDCDENARGSDGYILLVAIMARGSARRPEVAVVSSNGLGNRALPVPPY